MVTLEQIVTALLATVLSQKCKSKLRAGQRSSGDTREKPCQKPISPYPEAGWELSDQSNCMNYESA
jgi:hypothetical protein